ncbi:redoxin family protein [Flavobacterium silvaticum]|uniref:Redoxin family protein n=1 Tax=Flavobacterium silvaticum TaxID=1852020 RepID=A0A972JKR2_9FLAO|nr:redoxin family protein [Flavobacterium silvaticum]NMH29382.1 redoxin family protein [Flavobacterium silvaticum]
MGAFQNFVTAFKAEHIKKKGTGIYVLGLIFGAIAPIIGFIALFFNPPLNTQNTFPFNLFEKFISEFSPAFTGFFYPLAIIICVSRIAQLDHRYGGWQLMETQPLNKFSIYFSKFSVILIHNLITIFSFLLVGCALVAIGTLFKELSKGAELSVPVVFILQLSLRLFVVGLFFSAVQYLIAVLVPSFIWSIVIGFFGLLLSSVLAGFNIRMEWNPFTIMAKTGDFTPGSQLGHVMLYSEWVAVLLGLVFCAIGFQWYRYKSFKAAFFKKNCPVFALAVVAIASVGMYFMLKPLQYEAYPKTIIDGKIESDRQFRVAFLMDPFTGDTLGKSLVNDKKFKLSMDRNMPLGTYELYFQGDMSTGIQFVMSQNDSLYFDVKSFANNTESTITGTRLAENQAKAPGEFSWSMAEYMMTQSNEYLDKPGEVAETIASEWKEAIDESAGNKTRDNYIPKDDFLSLDKKRIHLRYLNLWNAYMDKRKVVFPAAAKDKEPKEITEIKKQMPLKDQTLLADDSYMQYLIHELTAKDTSDTDKNTRELKAISALKPDAFKDRLLFAKMKQSLREASGSPERAALMADYSKGIADVKLGTLLTSFYTAQERIARGNPAPDFIASDLDGKPVKLSDFKGKYVAIDVWATWCGPCRMQSPFFETKAISSKKNKNIVFVALSVDKDKGAWFLQAKTKSKSVKQLHIGLDDLFSKNYSVESIPRFILIDPNGNFVNSQLPPPSEAAFGLLLAKETESAVKS